MDNNSHLEEVQIDDFPESEDIIDSSKEVSGLDSHYLDKEVLMTENEVEICGVEDTDELQDIIVENEANSEEIEPSNEAISIPKKSKVQDSARYRPLNLPLARIKQIMKMDPDVHLAGSEAVFLIAKATELFIELLSKDSYAMTVASKKKTIQRKDVDSAIQNADPLVFLDGAMDF